MELKPELAISIAVFLGFVFSIVVHECAHAIVAYWRGDDTAYLLGRITLDPIPHIDPFMSILLPAALMLTTGWAFGGAKPVPVIPSNFRNPIRDMMWVAWAGPASNILLAIGFALVANAVVLIPDPDLAENVLSILKGIVTINLILAAFNLLPIPPLDGSRIMAGLLPPRQRDALMRLEPYGLYIIFGLMFLTGGLLLLPAFYAKEWIWNTFVFTAGG